MKSDKIKVHKIVFVLLLSFSFTGILSAQSDDEMALKKVIELFFNGLQNGDTIVLTKTLNVKGSTLNARQGTVVKNIRLAPNNTSQIEGRIEGELIVILTEFVRKQGS